MTDVRIGQTWSVLSNNALDRYELVIERIDGVGRQAVALGRTSSGKPARIPLSALRKGKRGARLVRDANGEMVVVRHPTLPLGLTMGTRLEGATARATIKPPRGLTPAERAEWLLKNERRTA